MNSIKQVNKIDRFSRDILLALKEGNRMGVVNAINKVNEYFTSDDSWKEVLNSDVYKDALKSLREGEMDNVTASLKVIFKNSQKDQEVRRRVVNVLEGIAIKTGESRDKTRNPASVAIMHLFQWEGAREIRSKKFEPVITNDLYNKMESNLTPIELGISRVTVEGVRDESFTDKGIREHGVNPILFEDKNDQSFFGVARRTATRAANAYHNITTLAHNEGIGGFTDIKNLEQIVTIGNSRLLKRNSGPSPN